MPTFVFSISDSRAQEVSREHSRDSLGRVRGGSEVATVIGCSLVVLGLAVLDFFLSARISFTLFYLLMIAFSAWKGGRRAGFWLAGIGLMALFAHELRIAGEHSPSWAVSWNLCMDAGVFLFAAILVSAVRGLTQNLERRVRDRTLSLEQEIAERQRTEDHLRRTMQQFRQLAENVSDAFWMREADEMRMIYVSPAYEAIWGRDCRELYQVPKRWLDAVHPEDRDRVASAIAAKQVAGEYNEEYRILRPDAGLRWIRDRAFPIRDRAGKVIRIVGIAEDITERRQLESQILEISDREQARIGQDLHDSLCQRLVSVAFDSGSLERKLSDRELPEAELARQMGDVLDGLITEARAVSRGLFPVQLEADGLALALQQLAASVTARGKINCQFECPVPVLVADNTVATHLYRIAQEAVNNAVKHSRAGVIAVELRADQERLEMKITDDGVGISLAGKPRSGLGLHTMEYRARTLGGALSVERRETGGTIVRCLVPLATTN